MLDILMQLPGRLFVLLIFSFFNYHIEKVCNFILLDINVVQCLEVSMFLLLCVLILYCYITVIELFNCDLVCRPLVDHYLRIVR